MEQKVRYHQRKNSKFVPCKWIPLIIVLALFVSLLTSGSVALSNREPKLSTQIFDRNGKLLHEIFDDQHRIFTPLGKIPKHLRLATIAVEDKRFYKHFGFDPAATARALKETIFDGQIQGGSTITQQYVRNAFLSPERTITRKIKEIFLAIFLERFNSKEGILEKYLNEVNYGGVNFGVATASWHYFCKEPKDLTLSESAFLASLPQAPSAFSPKNMDVTQIRQRVAFVLTKMRSLGFIDIDQNLQEVAKNEDLKFEFCDVPLRAPHFVMHVKDELIKKFGKDLVATGGLKVKTTLDLSMQEKTEKIVKEEVAKLKSFRVGNAAALVADPKTGEILAVVGSRDYFDPTDGSFNVITSSLRQPGSAIKPAMYAAAFEEGHTPATILFDIPTVFYNQWEKYAPVNYDGRFHGPLPVRYALGNSYNVPAIRMLATIGVDRFIQKARAMGITTLEKNGMGLSLTVGGGAVRPIELAQAYQTLANYGAKRQLFSILEIRDSKGNVLFKHTEKSEVVLDKRAAYILADILADNDARSWAFGSRSLLNIPGYKVAVKTGTSDDKRDNWAIGFNPEILVLAWVGNNDNSPMHPYLSSGITGATPIWHKITQTVLKDKANIWFEKPAAIIQKEVDFLTGQLACGSNYKRVEYFIQGTEPRECAKTKMVLVEKIDGQEKIIKEVEDDRDLNSLSESGVEVKLIPLVKDPLMIKTGSKSLIRI